jgi:hypothetical protein
MQIAYNDISAFFYYIVFLMFFNIFLSDKDPLLVINANERNDKVTVVFFLTFKAPQSTLNQ